MKQPRQPLRLGTRASPLAMAQARIVRDALCAAHGWSDDAVTILPVVATGDRITDRALADVGGKALWTRELDVSLAGGEIDFAVHSLKDVETIRPETFRMAAMLPREDVRDVLIGADSLEAIAHGATFGTSAPRRKAQILRTRPDLDIVLFRGNVQTRLAKIERGEAAATLLAAAGLARLGMIIGTALPVEQLLPAPSQAIIGVEARNDDDRTCALLAAIDHAPTHACANAERRLLAALSGDCRSPVAALAVLEGGMIWLRAEIYSPDGTDIVSGDARFSPGDPHGPEQLAHDLLSRATPPIREVFAG